MINNLISHYFLNEFNSLEMQIYLMGLFVVFFALVIDFAYNDYDIESSSYKFFSTIFGLFLLFDFTVFCILNYSLVITSVMNYFFSPLYYFADKISGNETKEFYNSIILLSLDIPPIFIVLFYLGSVGVFLSDLYYCVFAYLNLILFFIRKKTFAELINKQSWYNGSKFLEDFEKEFGKKNE